ncbi:MAG TPA: VWA domain-containing protein [Vicinamibacterales bacterium]|nr:VWA domain-containing protein [Vicinamibacterales bacterium]
MRLLLFAAFLFLQPIISVQTVLVAVPVTVTDAHGQPVIGLSQENFRVYEDGRLRPIELFRHGDAAVTLGLIVDRSQSMRSKSAALLLAVSALLQSSRPDDELFAVEVNDRAALLARPGGQLFTNDAKALTTALVESPAAGRTALYDGVAEGLRHLELGHAGKHALIVVSDGGDNASRETYAGIRTLARQSNTVIYAIGLLGTPPAGEDDDAGLLKRLCRDTGGVAFFPRTTDEIGAMATEIGRDLREQYTLGFTPGDRVGGPAFRKIEVKVTAPGRGRLTVRTRSGYFVPGGTDRDQNGKRP